MAQKHNINGQLAPLLTEITRNKGIHIERQISLCQLALDILAPETNPELWAELQNLLGISLAELPRGDRSANIEQAITAYHNALTVRTRAETPVEWAQTTANLANAYLYRVPGERMHNIEKAISLYKEVLQVMTLETLPLQWSQAMNNLGAAYLYRIKGEQADNIEQAIVAHQQALRVRSKTKMPDAWAETVQNLAVAYQRRIDGNRADNMEMAISAYQEVLEVVKREVVPVQWASILENLATAFFHRIRGERLENIERAVESYHGALRVFNRETMPFKWAQTMMNVANVYRNRIQGNRAENVDQAIEAYLQVLEVRTREDMPYDWVRTMINLGNAYSERLSGDLVENTEMSIDVFGKALEVARPDNYPHEWGIAMLNLATAYRSRMRGDRAQNIDMAIHANHQALQVLTYESMPAEYATIMMNLGNAYRNRIHGNHTENMENAIVAYGEALRVYTRDGMPFNWAQVMMNMGTAYRNRVVGDRDQNIELAIDYYRKALQVLSITDNPIEWAETMHNLANAYLDRIDGPFEGSVDKAVEAYKQALRIHKLDTAPRKHLLTQQLLGDVFFKEQNWQEANTAYSGAIAAVQVLFQVSATSEVRTLELHANGKLAANCSYCLSHLGQLEAAVVSLEQARTRILSETLLRREAILNEVSELDLFDFTIICQRIDQLEAEARAVGCEPWARDFLAVSTDLRQARQELAAIVARICNYVPDFIPKGLDYTGIAAIATAIGQPLVYLTTTLHGSLGLLVLPYGEKVSCIWLDGFNEHNLNQVLYDKDGDKRYLQSIVIGEMATLTHVLDTFWPVLTDKLIAPVADTLQRLGCETAVLIPTGTLSLLPLHAVTLNTVVFTLVPSAHILRSALKLAQERSTKSPMLVGVANPQANRQLPLAYAQLEVATITPMFGMGASAPLTGVQATKTAVIQRVDTCTHLHFACHGRFALEHPLDSTLYLAGDDTLTLRDLMDGRLDISSAQLAVLSACQTGITDFQHVPDEAIGFPTGFLQAGVPGVISTLWPVDDVSTALLMIRFYQHLLQDEWPPAQALPLAQRWLRDVTAGELAMYFAERRQKQGTAREQISAGWRRFAALEPKERPFSHPYYWAAFTFTGA